MFYKSLLLRKLTVSLNVNFRQTLIFIELKHVNSIFSKYEDIYTTLKVCGSYLSFFSIITILNYNLAKASVVKAN